MMNVELPATEALNVSMSAQMIPEREIRKAAKLVTPQASNDSLESAPTCKRRKRSFDMADLLNATAPVEQAIAFPAIEWCNDGESDSEEENTEKPLHVISPCEIDDDDRDEHDDYFPSRFSTTGLGKRSRLGYRQLGRSRSLKTSLCSLAEQSTSTFEDECSKPGGSWPKFSMGTYSEARDARRQHKRQKSLKSTQQDLQMNILLPLVS